MDWQGIPVDWQWYREGLKRMAAAATVPIETGIEVGLGWGTSALWFLEQFPQARLLSFDVNQKLDAVPILLKRFPDRFAFLNPRWACMPDQHLRVQWLYIDGDHTYEGVREDLKKFLWRLDVGGVLAFDDYANPDFPGVTRAVDEFIKGQSNFAPLTLMPDLPLQTGPAFTVKLK